MKILAIGDFHGAFPSKLRKKIMKEKFDIIVSTGDFCYDKELERLFFKYSYGTDKELWEFIGKSKNSYLERKNLLAGFRVLKKLKRLGKPVITVTGNWDPVDYEEVGFPRVRDPNSKRFKSFIKKMDFKIIDFKRMKYSSLNFVGYPRSTYPGKTNFHIQKKFKERFKGEIWEIFDKIKFDNEKYFKIFKRLIDKNTIFISHNTPYRTKLDMIKKEIQKGRHYGSYLVKKIIKELKPRLVICGHMHENQGIQRIGRTLVVNIGAAYKSKAAIIDYPENEKDKIEIRLIK